MGRGVVVWVFVWWGRVGVGGGVGVGGWGGGVGGGGRAYLSMQVVFMVSSRMYIISVAWASWSTAVTVITDMSCAHLAFIQ